MKRNLIATALISAAISVSGVVLAQTNADQSSKPESFTHGESKRCESMTGPARDECDREEATKTERPDAESRDTPSAAVGATGARFTHGESKRCETMTGAAKEQCDRQEATK
jgi:hypothetical protein